VQKHVCEIYQILSTKLIQSSVFSAWDSSSWSRRTLAVNTTLPAFAAERRAAGHPSLSIDILPTVRSPLLNRVTGQKDGRTPDRYIDAAQHSMRAASMMYSIISATQLLRIASTTLLCSLYTAAELALNETNFQLNLHFSVWYEGPYMEKINI